MRPTDTRNPSADGSPRPIPGLSGLLNGPARRDVGATRAPDFPPRTPILERASSKLSCILRPTAPQPRPEVAQILRHLVSGPHAACGREYLVDSCLRPRVG